MPEQLAIRLYPAPGRPSLLYLPGLHGDSTLVGSFRRALSGQVQFLETTYPRTLDWSLEQYARAIESRLAALHLQNAWLLGESFGSQLAWTIAARNQFPLQGLILAGGFVRHPMPRIARLAELATDKTPFALLKLLTFFYAKLLRRRYRHAPEVLDSLDAFISRRTDLDRHAAAHRLALMRLNDLRPHARALHVPLFALAGAFDPVVPWSAVRRWLRTNCPALREFRIIPAADHVVLATAADAAARAVLEWLNPAVPNPLDAHPNLPKIGANTPYPA